MFFSKILQHSLLHGQVDQLKRKYPQLIKALIGGIITAASYEAIQECTPFISDVPQVINNTENIIRELSRNPEHHLNKAMRNFHEQLDENSESIIAFLGGFITSLALSNRNKQNPENNLTSKACPPKPPNVKEPILISRMTNLGKSIFSSIQNQELLLNLLEEKINKLREESSNSRQIEESKVTQSHDDYQYIDCTYPNNINQARFAASSKYTPTSEDIEWVKLQTGTGMYGRYLFENANTALAKAFASNPNYTPTRDDIDWAKSNRHTLAAIGFGSNPNYQYTEDDIQWANNISEGSSGFAISLAQRSDFRPTNEIIQKTLTRKVFDEVNLERAKQCPNFTARQVDSEFFPQTNGKKIDYEPYIDKLKNIIYLSLMHPNFNPDREFIDESLSLDPTGISWRNYFLFQNSNITCNYDQIKKIRYKLETYPEHLITQALLDREASHIFKQSLNQK